MTRELQHNLKEMIHPTINKIKGVIGLSRLVVNVTNRPGFVWVRLADNLNEAVKAHNSKVSPVFGMPVEMTFDGKKYEIIGRDVDRYSEWNSNAAFLAPHGGQHSAMRDAAGDDIVWVDPQQFLPLLTLPNGITGTTGIQEVPYIYRNTQGNWGYPGASGITIPVGTNPTGSRMFLMVLNDSDGTFYGITGAYFASGVSGTANIVSHIPNLPATSNDKPLSAIRMEGIDPKVRWENIYDVRQFISNGNSLLLVTTDGTLSGNGTAGSPLHVESVSSLFVTESDGAPTGTGVGTLVVSNGTLSVSGTVAYISTAASGGVYPKTGTVFHDQGLVISGNALLLSPSSSSQVGYAYQNPPANTDKVDNGFVLAAGTYTFYMLCATENNRAIADIKIDGSSIGTIDNYSAGTVNNVLKSIGSVSISDGYHKLSVEVNGKNGSSSNYYLVISKMWFTPASF